MTTPKKPIQYDYSLLREQIKSKFITSKNLCDQLNWNRRTFSQKINNYLEFSQSEILKLAEILEIKDKDIMKFFFNIEIKPISKD